MKFTTKLMIGAAALTMIGFTMQSTNAKTVTTKTYTKTQDIEGAKEINFSYFDINNDGRYSMREVGNKLFYVFDTDGNEVIDNIEWKTKNVMTIVPMEKETFKFIDYNNDGVTDVSEYTYDQFYTESGLMKFDETKDGLSAADFVETPLGELDTNDNNMIEIDEWKAAYFAKIGYKHNDQENYN